MHLTYMALAALAASGGYGVGFGVVFEAPLAAPERTDIEVVFRDSALAIVCTGCESSYTDSMESGDSWTCPNGDRWDFSVGTPTVQDADCRPALYLCVKSGACTFSRVGTATFHEGGVGDCALFFRVDEDEQYQSVTDGMQFTLDCSVTCRSGSPGQQDCKYRTIEFYDTTDDDNVVMMSWDVNFCCSKCPD